MGKRWSPAYTTGCALIRLSLFALIVGYPAASAQQQTLHAGEYAQADIQYGATVYEAQCTQCHGPNGDQVSGVELRSGRFRNAASDDDLRRIVTIGIPGTSMPGRRLDTAEATGLIAYIRNMRDFNSSSVTPGDRARGQAVFEGTGRCTTCHRVNGRGSRTAPDLSEIGTSRAASSLQQSIIDPSSMMVPINRPVRIVTKDGKTITGRRLNEDTYTIQLIDDQEHLLSLSKSDVREFTILKTSSMPSYKGQIGSQELADLVAYLVTLKGK
jgi:cytochrome c oxidase cbb3-type subunit III